ncbi:hypothetical protein GCM10027259_29230 [Micromonospora palomenae]
MTLTCGPPTRAATPRWPAFVLLTVDFRTTAGGPGRGCRRAASPLAPGAGVDASSSRCVRSAHNGIRHTQKLSGSIPEPIFVRFEVDAGKVATIIPFSLVALMLDFLCEFASGATGAGRRGGR